MLQARANCDYAEYAVLPSTGESPASIQDAFHNKWTTYLALMCRTHIMAWSSTTFLSRSRNTTSPAPTRMLARVQPFFSLPQSASPHTTCSQSPSSGDCTGLPHRYSAGKTRIVTENFPPNALNINSLNPLLNTRLLNRHSKKTTTIHTYTVVLQHAPPPTPRTPPRDRNKTLHHKAEQTTPHNTRPLTELVGGYDTSDPSVGPAHRESKRDLSVFMVCWASDNCASKS